MKKALSLILAIAMSLSLCACGGNENEPTIPTTIAPTDPPTAKEQLNEQELALFNYLVKLTSDDFFEPSAVRVLEIGDYEDRGKYKEIDSLYGPNTIVVRLQGENKVGGTLNHHYLIALNSVKNTSDYAQNLIKLHRSLGNYDEILEYQADAGEYAQLSEYYTIDRKDENYNVGNINRAIAEYWEEMGF